MSKHNVQSEEQAKHEALKKSEVEEVVTFFKQNGKSLALIVALAVVVSLGLAKVRQNRHQQHQEAMLLLTEAQQAEHLQTLIEAYPKTPAAMVARLELASMLYAQGEYEEARAAYRAFRETYPRHDLAASTLLSEALCMEALGNYDQALEQLDAFLRDHPGHFLAAPALLAKGRSLELAGRAEESQAVLEQFLEEYEGTPWEQEADESLRRVQFLLRSLARPRTPAPIPEGIPPAVDLPAVELEDAALPPIEPDPAPAMPDEIDPGAAVEPDPVIGDEPVDAETAADAEEPAAEPEAVADEAPVPEDAQP